MIASNLYTPYVSYIPQRTNHCPLYTVCFTINWKSRQAALTGGTLRLERALDDKERELQLQRGEIHGLRERLRAANSGTSQGGSRNVWNDSLLSDSPSGGNLRRGSGAMSNGGGIGNVQTPPSLLGPRWMGGGGGSGGDGRGDTAPYPDPDGSRAVSPSDGWAVDQVRAVAESHLARDDLGGGSGLRRATGAAGGRLSGGGGAGTASSVLPPGAHVPLTRVGSMGGMDLGLVLEASGVRAVGGGE